MSSSSNKILINSLPKYLKPLAKFIRHQEDASGLSTTRYIQDVSTCLIPKAVFARSLADLTENSFLDLSEEALVYLTPALIGEKFARKVFSKGLCDGQKKEVATTGVELINKARTDFFTKENNKKTIPVKAAIALTATAIPLAEYSLNYIKNLLTLKLFNKSDFKNIASLENNTEDKAQQEKVKNSAKKHILGAASLYAGLLSLAGVIALNGSKSNTLYKLSEFIIAPGNKLFKNNIKAKNFFNKYFNIDFAKSHDGKMVLSKGQLTTCVTVGGLGYFGASADRGKENLKETATRFPLVGLYVITGSELVEKGFKVFLHKHKKCQDVLKNEKDAVAFKDLGELASKLAKERKTTPQKEFEKLVKQKGIIFGIPYLFSLLVMGFFVAGMTVRATRKRYEQQKNRLY